MFRRLLRYFRAHAMKIAVASVLALIAGATSAAPVALIKFVIDGVFGGKELPELDALQRFGLHIDPSLPGGQEALLGFLVASVIVLYLVNATSQFLQDVLLRGVGLRVVQRLRSELFARLQALSLEFMGSHPTGDLMSRIINDANSVQGTVSQIVVMYREPATLLALVAVAFWMNWRLALFGLIGLPAIGLSLRLLSRAMRRYAARTQAHLGSLTSVLQESLAGAMVVRAFGLEKRETERFDAAQEDVVHQSLKAVRASAAVGPVVIALGAAGAAVVLWLGGKQVLAGVVTAGDLIAFITASMAAYDPTRKISKTYNQLQQVLAAAERMFAILDAPITVQDNGTQTAPEPIESVRFDGVEFAYEADAPVLRGVTCEGRHGQLIALVGESGAGKTTLLNLVPRFYDVQGGAIRINGIDIREMTLASLRRRMALVTQDTFLFDDTVANNIRQGRLDASDADVQRAAEVAYAAGFIAELPQGYDTMLGERGARLSGGQRQRIAIARAVLRDAPILLLDEATSSLDSESEEEVQRALEELMAHRTTFVIAHRLSTIQKADQIVVLSAGRVVETGTHASLLAKGGEYRRLYDIQFRASETLAPETATGGA